MHRFVIGFVVLAGIVGCNQPRETTTKETTTKVTAPGTNVEVQKGGGVHVNAPGVNVNVEK